MLILLLALIAFRGDSRHSRRASHPSAMTLLLASLVVLLPAEAGQGSPTAPSLPVVADAPAPRRSLPGAPATHRPAPRPTGVPEGQMSADAEPNDFRRG